MPLRVGQRVFAPGLAGTAVMLAGLAAFVNLGLWQLRRAEEKREAIATFRAGQSSIADFGTAAAGALPRYQRVRANGRYEPGRQLLLDNMPSDEGAPGYRVLTPFSLEDGGLVMVDRGWVPLGRDRSMLPDVAVDDGARTITAILDELPRPGIRLGEAAIGTGPWPRVVNYPQHAELVTEYGGGLLPPVLLLDAAEPDGYQRAWQARFGFTPERHVGYALQWFALATTVLVTYVLLGFRTAPGRTE